MMVCGIAKVYAQSISMVGPSAEVETTETALKPLDTWMTDESETVTPKNNTGLTVFEVDSVLIISWFTKHERNNEYFILERSIDGVIFEKVGVIKGSGKSHTQKNYAFTDESPYKGNSFYRINKKNNKGCLKNSKLLEVTFGMGHKNKTPQPIDKIQFPELADLGDREVLLILKNSAGQEFYSKFMILQINTELLAIDLEKRTASGNYTVIGTSYNNMYGKKVLVR